MALFAAEAAVAQYPQHHLESYPREAGTALIVLSLC